jgi:glycosyltransferase involved in cell wall biosynthesis
MVKPMSIRLLYITAEAFPTYHADLAVLFGKYLPRLGLFTDIVTEAMNASASSKSTLNWDGGEALLCQVPANRGFYHIVKFMHNVSCLLRCDPKKYDAIQVRDLPIAALFALLIARYKKLPFYYWMSYPQSEGQIHRAKSRGWRAGIRYFFPLILGHIGKFVLYKLVMPYADHNFVQSTKMREDLVALGLSYEKMTPVPMAVDLETARIEDIQPIDDDRLAGKRVVIYMGTLGRNRQIDVLFQMLAVVRKKQPDILLVIAGSTEDTDHLAWLKKEAERIGVNDAILWVGWMPMTEAWRYARASEVGLSPVPRGFLLDMGIPTKVLEYMALNVPVLCNDNPYQEQAVKESGAGLCVSLTAENFAEALLELLENTAQRKRMATLGRQYITEFWNYEKLAADVFAVYQNLLKRSGI